MQQIPVIAPCLLPWRYGATLPRPVITKPKGAGGVPTVSQLHFREGRNSMPTFMCFLNWTDQAAKALKDAPKRYEATKALVTKLGGRLVCAYVTTGLCVCHDWSI